MARLKCPRGEKAVTLCVPEETPTRLAGLGPREKCPTGMKPVSACPSDLSPGPTPEGQSFPYPVPERHGLGAGSQDVLGTPALMLKPAELQVTSGFDLKKLKLGADAMFWVPSTQRKKKRLNLTLYSKMPGGGSREVLLTVSPDDVRGALAAGHHSFVMSHVMSTPMTTASVNYAIELTPEAVSSMLVWLDGLEERGLAGLGAPSWSSESYDGDFEQFEPVKFEPVARVVVRFGAGKGREWFSLSATKIRELLKVAQLSTRLGPAVPSSRGSMSLILVKDLQQALVSLDQLHEQGAALDGTFKRARTGAVTLDKVPTRGNTGTVPEENIIWYGPLGVGAQMMMNLPFDTFMVYVFDTEPNREAYVKRLNNRESPLLFKVQSGFSTGPGAIDEIFTRAPKGLIAVYLIAAAGTTAKGRDAGDDASWNDLIYVDMMSVLEKWQRQGLNTMMMATFKEKWPGRKLDFSKPTHKGKAFIESRGLGR